MGNKPNPGPVEHVHPNLCDTGFSFHRLEDVETPDFVLLALPTSATVKVARRFLEAGARVIDLGSAFRLRDRSIWERVYAQKYTEWSLAAESVYGIPELHEEAISAKGGAHVAIENLNIHGRL